MSLEDDWTGRRAIVTGASRGIGRAVAAALAHRGAQVVLLARDRDRLEEVAASCRELAPGGAEPYLLPVDVTDAAALEASAGQALAQLDHRLDLLANVAGSALRHARLEATTEEDWHQSLSLNLLSAVRLQRACFDALTAASGAIVNVGSIVAGRAAVLGSPYAAAKAALASLTRNTALEWARHGIRANVVEPGYVATDFNAQLVEAGLEDRLLQRVPTRTAISAEAVARCILFAGSPHNQDMTGSTLTVDGGYSSSL